VRVALIAAVVGLLAVVPAAAQPAAPATEADVRFMRHMIVHHGQALEMTALVPERSQDPAVRLLARRIEASQADEIERMRAWLAARGEANEEPDASLETEREGVERHDGGHSHHHGGEGHAPPMPGMLTAAELAELASASGGRFDRLFLEGMIRHHEGALEMVAELMAADGAAQDPALFRFASHVDSDQRIEITRMREMLEAMDEGSRE
jgi:uncharacterized protein (DUF305 family)